MMFRATSLILVALTAVPAWGAITLGIVDGRTWHDFNHDGSFSDGVSAPGAFSYIAYTDGSQGSRAAIEFDLSALPGGPVSGATLSLFFRIARDLNDPNLGPPRVELLGYAGDGQVNAADVLATNLLTEFSASPSAAVSIDVTQFVQSLRATNQRYAGFALRIKDDLGPATRAEAWFASELGSASERPSLQVETVPEPAAASIWLALGLVGLAVVRFDVTCRFR